MDEKVKLLLIFLLEKLRIKKLSPAFGHFNSFASKIKKLAKETGFKFENQQ